MSFQFTGRPTLVVSDRDLSLPASVVAIGAFDGVHQGHQQLISEAVRDARAEGVPAIVWTFDPPPKVFFGRAARLSTLDDKLARIARLGPDLIAVASFTASYCARSAGAFLGDLARIGPRRVHVGADFRFGAKQTGDVELLAARFETRLARPVVCAGGEPVSSTRIRALRRAGDIAGAAVLQSCPGPAALLAGRLQMHDTRYEEDPHVRH
ncbi:FAD synthetase family protein [Salipiger mucosus]|uniref:FAD synthase n=1 Tax=Salipiger mucosus DSM 16094 TaxID=1123237 RepID=S9RES8_9RHOB|nr:FAD synthetase family protein [Salipiger mucosus]EPX76605.1 Riboflavin kinase / FMN adenylyltransferase [Salipiger mucosus DSM 16094]